MKTERYVEELLAALRCVGDEERAQGAKAYLKSDLDFIGVRAADLRAVARDFLGRYPELDSAGLEGLVRALWSTSVYEGRAVAVALLERKVGYLDLAALGLVEDLLRRSHTWALVDWLSNKVAAPLVEREPSETRATLVRWSRDSDFWVRRASMLALLPELRAGRGDFKLFALFATSMISEREFFIRKAIGWVLREVGKKRPWLTYEFLSEHLNKVSGLSLREGSKYLPSEQRELLQRRFKELRSRHS